MVDVIRPQPCIGCKHSSDEGDYFVCLKDFSRIPKTIGLSCSQRREAAKDAKFMVEAKDDKR